MTADALLRLAYVDLEPGRSARLVASFGAAGVLRRIERGAIDVPPEARAAAGVPADERRAQLARLGIDFVPVHVEAAGAFGALARLPGAPRWLFVRGRLPELPLVAVVGTRRCTAYGRDLARAYGRAISEAGWAVVSGLARGIDGAAHRGTVDVAAPGIAVLGCGLDVAYPRAHVRLRERLVAAGGALVGEYPPGAEPRPWRFPIRNRIIAGLAAAVVVVETPARGGSTITVSHALEYGRAVFAVPGDVDRPTSVGCNLLIRDGAHPVLDPVDLVEELGLVVGPPRSAVEAPR